MASNMLTKEEQNFIRFVKARDDVMPLPLRDILDWQIKPKDLHQKIQSCSVLNNGDKRLDSNQINLTKKKDYSNFDVTLLYKLIRNLCLGLKPTQGWGNVLNYNDTTIGDDIERIRVLRNKLGHSKSSNIPDSEFTNHWTELKIVIERLQKAMSKNGYNTDYKEKITAIEKLDFGDDPREKYKTFLVLEHAYDCLQQAKDREEAAVSIAGNEHVMCGESAVFEAEVTDADSSCWSLTWQKTKEHVTESININKDKYLGSTYRKLVITSVDKEDEWKYQAVLNLNGNKQKILSNEILLQALGEAPSFAVWKVTTDNDGIIIHYEVENKRPSVINIKWTKNGNKLNFENPKYAGGSLEDKSLRIASPTVADVAKYCCTITNAVESASMDVTLNIPKAKISTESQSYFGSCTSIVSEVVSCPVPDKAEWQKSVDGQTFKCIDVRETKYHGSCLNPESPSLEINPISFDDKQHYRLWVWNKIGEQGSNTVFLNVIGSPPNVTTSHETCFENHSVKLIGMVFLYEERPKIENLFWSRNGQKIKSQVKGKYSEVSINHPSLTIFDVNQHDAGSYRLTAENAVRSTESEAIVLGIPDVFLEKKEKREDGSWWFTMTIQSIPSPCFVQWIMKEKNSDSFEILDVNAEEYRGTSNSLPRPVLVIKHCEKLQRYFFQIKVENFIGSCNKTIQDYMNPETFTPNTKKPRILSKLYNDEGLSVTFANLFDELAENFPINKIQRLQDFIGNSGKVGDTTSIKRANCARECFRILRDENLFTPEDVIFIQYLLKKTNCEELYTKCYNYAKAQKSLCFYEMPTENGFQKVKFHVEGYLKEYTTDDIKLIINTVAKLLNCTTNDILIGGFDHASSFHLIVAIREAYIRNLFDFEENDEEKLAELSINCFIVDILTVYLRHPKEDGFTQVRFRIRRYTYLPSVEMVRKTVAALVKCAANDIFVCKTDYHIPYIDVVVSIRQAYIRNLLGLKDPAKKKLIGLNIECFIADSVTVFLCRTKGYEERIAAMQSMQENFHKEFCLEDKYGQPKIPLPIPNDIQRLKKGELFVDDTAECIVRKLFLFLKKNIDFEYEQDNLIQQQLLDEKEKEDHICKDQCKAFWCERYLKLLIMEKRCTKFLAYIHHTPSLSYITYKLISRENEEINKSTPKVDVQGFPFTLTYEVLQKHKYFLYTELEPREIADEMFQSGFITCNDHDSITDSQQKYQRFMSLVDILQEKNLYSQFVYTLQASMKYISVLETLKEGKPNFSPFVGESALCIQHNFTLLQKELPDPDCITAVMDHLFDNTNLYDIDHCRGKIRRKSKLLKILLIKGNPACVEFLKVIEANLESLRVDLIKEMKTRSDYIKSRGRPDLSPQLERLGTWCLREQHEFLLDELEPVDICDFLLEERAIEIMTHEKITETEGRRQQVKALLQTLQENENDCFHYFLYIIEKNKFNDIRKVFGSPFASEAMREEIQEQSDWKLANILEKVPEIREQSDWKLANILEKVPETTVSSSLHFQDTVIHTTRITLPSRSNFHISCQRSARLWATDDNEIFEMNDIGNMLKKLDVKGSSCGHHTLTKKGELLFLNENRVYKLGLKGDLGILCIPVTISYCIHSSQIDGDVLVGSKYDVIRYKDSGDLLQIIHLDNKEDANDVTSMYITENINKDVIVSCGFMKKVVAVDKAGRHRFDYRGYRPNSTFFPLGICTDVIGQILVCSSHDHVSNVHLLDVDGHFLSYLLTLTYGLDSRALCVDDKHNLYVGSFGQIDVYSYLTDAMLGKHYIYQNTKELMEDDFIHNYSF